VLRLVLLYEIDSIRRFPEVGNFLSYARLVRCEHESAGKYGAVRHGLASAATRPRSTEGAPPIRQFT